MPKFKPKSGTSTPWTEEWTPTEIIGHLNGNGDLVDLEFRAVKIRQYEDGTNDRVWANFRYPKPTDPGQDLARFEKIERTLDQILDEQIPK